MNISRAGLVPGGVWKPGLGEIVVGAIQAGLSPLGFRDEVRWRVNSGGRGATPPGRVVKTTDRRPAASENIVVDHRQERRVTALVTKR